MKKKLLAALLCVSMTATLFTGCGNKETTANEPETKQAETVSETPETTEEPETTAPAPEAALAAPEELPAEAFAHLTFDEGTEEGYKAVVQTDAVGDNDGATYGIEETEATFAYAAGPVGNALYLDGSYGLDLGLEPTNTDAYTVSFWLNADRLSSYGPTLQMGYDMGKAADVGNNVTWLNVTQSEWGENSAKIFPIVWSRNEASDAADGTDCWPWMYSFDNEIHGKKEWIMVTIVCSGEVQNGATGATTAGAQYYVNGVKVYDSQDNYTNNSYFEYTWDATLAPNIMKPDGKDFESLFGINYWDTIYKGFVDDLYVYDSALTAGQVATLFGLGDPTVESVAGEGGAAEDEEGTTIELPEITADASAADVLGTTARDMAFWSDWSDAYELADGATKTVVLNNYSNCTANWCNYVVAFTNTETKGHTAPADQSASYAEYAVVRADAFGWGDASYAGEFTCSWGDDWDAFLTTMADAEVKIEMTRNGGEIVMNTTFTAADGTTYTEEAKLTSTLTAEDPCYFFLTGEGCYVEILSVE